MANYYLRKNKNEIMIKTPDGNLYLDLDSKYLESEMENILKRVWDLGRRYERSMQ